MLAFHVAVSWVPKAVAAVATTAWASVKGTGDFCVRGTRNAPDLVSYRNAGAGGYRVVLVDGTDNRVRVGRVVGASTVGRRRKAPSRLGVSKAGGTYTPVATHQTTYVATTTPAALTIGVPTYPVADDMLTIEVANASGGAITTTWNAVYVLNGAWAEPANGARKAITFQHDGTNWREIGRSG